MDDRLIEEAFNTKKKGDRLLSEGRLEEALEAYSHAEKICRKTSSWFGLAQILTGKGFAYDKLHDFNQAKIFFEQALEIFMSNGSLLESARLKFRLGLLYKTIKDFSSAIELFEESGALFDKIGNAEASKEAESELAYIKIETGRVQLGLEELKTIRDWFIDNGNKQAANFLNLNIARAHTLLGNLEKANSIYENEIRFYKQFNELLTVGKIYQNQAYILYDMLEFEQALETVNRARECFNLIGAQPNYARTQLQAAELLVQLNQLDLARDKCLEARKLFNELKLDSEIGKTYRLEAEILRNESRFSEALQSISLSEKLTSYDNDELGKIITEKALLFESIGDLESALEYWHNGLKLQTELGKQWDAAISATCIARVMIDRGDNESALDLLNTAVDEFPDLFDKTWQIPGLYGQVYRDSDINLSIKYYKEAVDFLENQRAEITLHNRFSYFNNKMFIYRQLIANLMLQKNAVDALLYSEKSRARGFGDAVNNVISGSAANITRPDIDIYDMDLNLLKSLYGPECTFLYASVLDDLFYIFLFDTNGQIKVCQMNVSEDHLIELFREIYIIFGQAVSGSANYLAMPQEYYRIFSPVYDFILDYTPPGNTLLVFPNVILNLLPFNAIPRIVNNNGANQLRFLIEDFPIVRSPSITMLNYAKKIQTSKHGRARIIGNPAPPGNLINSEREAIAIAKLMNVNPILNESATKENFTEDVDNFDVIHIASHGNFQNENLAESGIVLADGLLNVEKIMDLDICASLVALPCCESGRTTLHIGDDWMDVVKAFLLSSKSVLASLWQIDDEASAAITVDFYKNWHQNNLDKAKSLQQAQVNYIEKARRKAREARESVFTLEFRGKENRKLHPYYWAGLQFYGDWEG